MSSKYYTLFLAFFLCSFLSFSQTTISGKITDAKNNSVSEAYILNLKSGHHTHSDTQGNFTIAASKNDSIKIHHLGFGTVYFEVGAKQNYAVKLQTKMNLIDEIVIAPKINALSIFSEINTRVNPVNSSQDLLRYVPGLFIGQHAGGGKAEQMFLRGFDIDHGTDINVSVDGMPVNLVSHAHGQGYSDLHFLIPETVNGVNFGKGPYTTSKGNFSTAGFVSFNTKDQLEDNLIKAEIGQFNTQRFVGMFKVLDSRKESAYIASEYLGTDGPFDSPQLFSRINLMGKYVGQLSAKNRFKAIVSYFTSEWDASGQIPQRAIDSGLISRFGAIDDTEGGETSRTNIILNNDYQIDDQSGLSTTLYYSKYDFLLFSNFTFFLNDPENGDQIKQKETREIYGLTNTYHHKFYTNEVNGDYEFGISLRNDQSRNNELSHTVNRAEVLDSLSFGNINETNYSVFANANFHFGKWTLNPGLRLDYFKFMYEDGLIEKYTNTAENKAILSPKVNILYNLKDNVQLYLKSGKSFHSNDTRVVIQQEGREILPAAYGSDLGFIWKPVPKLILNTAFWYLYLEQEFVYVGDEAVVEPSGKTVRKGIDFSLRYQPFNWLNYDLDVNGTLARAKDEPDGEDYIPLAPDFTFTSGINIIHPSGVYGGLHARHMNSRAANEDNSIVAEGYTVFDFNAGYRWNHFDFGLSIQNIFDTDWNETQFATTSRLAFEDQPVEEIHFTPGTPFFLKGIISYRF
ncbi:TonB-dependent receptor [Zunongwangia sp.]|uniref:TonB-dependent receptor n=1 Tax=Zunongwangia sp. TaxID=1965325 RepID=UPI003AA7D938